MNMELTIIETSAYLELKRQLSTLSVQVEDLALENGSTCSGQMNGRRRRYAWHWESEEVSPGLP